MKRRISTSRALKNVEHESDVYTNSNRYSWYSHRKINIGTRGLGNKRTNRDHPS